MSELYGVTSWIDLLFSLFSSVWPQRAYRSWVELRRDSVRACPASLRWKCDHAASMREHFFFVNVRNRRPVHELKAPWFTGERITTERNWHPVHELWTKRDRADEWTNLDKRGHTVSLGCRAFSSRSAVTHNCSNRFSSTFTFHLDYKLSFCCTLQIQGLCLPVLLSNCPKNISFCASLSLPLWIRQII